MRLAYPRNATLDEERSQSASWCLTYFARLPAMAPASGAAESSCNVELAVVKLNAAAILREAENARRQERTIGRTTGLEDAARILQLAAENAAQIELVARRRHEQRQAEELLRSLQKAAHERCSALVATVRAERRATLERLKKQNELSELESRQAREQVSSTAGSLTTTLTCLPSDLAHRLRLSETTCELQCSELLKRNERRHWNSQPRRHGCKRALLRRGLWSTSSAHTLSNPSSRAAFFGKRKSTRSCGHRCHWSHSHPVAHQAQARITRAKAARVLTKRLPGRCSKSSSRMRLLFRRRNARPLQRSGKHGSSSCWPKPRSCGADEMKLLPEMWQGNRRC